MSAFEQITDELLVLWCQEGDADAFEALVERWQERLWRHAWRLTNQEDAAWDVLQETWIIVSRDIRRLEDAAAFRSWVYRIASNKCHDWVRRQGRRRRADEAYSERFRETDDRASGASRQAATLDEALSRLPGSDRAILALRYMEGFDTSEIAEILRVPAGTVKSRLHYRFSYSTAEHSTNAAVETNGVWTHSADLQHGYDTNEFSRTVVLPAGAEVLSVDPWPANSFTLLDKPAIRFAGVRGPNEPFKYKVTYRIVESSDDISE
jgi:RNA polymerase sigma-70 factor (ECF subfamily)